MQKNSWIARVAKWRLALLVIGVSFLVGCSFFAGDKDQGPLKGFDTRLLQAEGYTFDEKGAQRMMPPDDGRPSIVMEVRNGKRHFERIPLHPDKPTLVQDVVDDAKLVDKLGKIEISLLRSVKPNAPPVRMEVDFDPDTKRVVVSQNYALQPNDQLLVTKDTRSWLDKIGIFSRPTGN